MFALRSSSRHYIAPLVRRTSLASSAHAASTSERYAAQCSTFSSSASTHDGPSIQVDSSEPALPKVTALGPLDRSGRVIAGKIRFVLLSNLPRTTTPQDVKALASNHKMANSLGRIEFLYDRHLKPIGKALLTFSSENHAFQFARENFRRAHGDHVLKTRLLSQNALDDILIRHYGYWPAEYQIPFDLIEYDPAKLVLLSNLPQFTTEARLEERLTPRYDLRPQDRWRARRVSRAHFLLDSKGYGGNHEAVIGSVLKIPKANDDATTASFIVRCQTPIEAMRLFRRWHNTYFAPASFGIQETAGRFRVEASILY